MFPFISGLCYKGTGKILEHLSLLDVSLKEIWEELKKTLAPSGGISASFHRFTVHFEIAGSKGVKVTLEKTLLEESLECVEQFNLKYVEK